MLEAAGASNDAVANAVLCRSEVLKRAGGVDQAISECDRGLTISPKHHALLGFRAKLIAKKFWSNIFVERPVLDKHQLLSPPYNQMALPDRGSTNPLHWVHCMDWLDQSACERVIAAAEEFGWGCARHDDFPTVDVEVSELPAEIRDWFVGELDRSLLPTMASLFSIPASRLAVKEAFVVKYSSEPGGQSSLALHRDGLPFSFNVALNDPASFQGGGTRFESLDQTVLLENPGDVMMHSGQMLHGGQPVLRGVRYILVGFVNVENPDVSEMVADEQDEEDLQDEGEQEVGLLEQDIATLARYWRIIGQ
eukprot:TRINITY_DN12390_c0_g2_i2.p1 TRINITY_DN12390_c0_g2~~TRINITY_DN12390_c0_g2_i2.p1  ORF type:complete len:308 (-),score=68.67 TRINITY_DN12390_c0_g2_i2:252-1175(-)